MMKRFFTLLLMLLPLVSWGQGNFPTDSWLDYAETDWYINNPSAASYTITSAAQLAGMAKLALWDPIRGCVEFEGKTITLDIEGDELDLSAHEWFPIGRGGSYNSKIVGLFKGSFDGGNCKIKGLYIDDMTANAMYGLFGNLNADGDGTAEIKNVHIESGHVRAGYQSAGVCGMSSGTISNCTNAATIELHPDANVNTNLGGICGYSTGKVSKVINCTNSGNILATNENYMQSPYIGGICGSGGCLENCTNTGAIQVVLQNFGYIGGVCGMAVMAINAGVQTSIKTCSNAGDISIRAIGSNMNTVSAGGVAGYFQGGELVESYNTGAITISIENSECWADYGGVLGSNLSGTIRSCYNTGTLTLLGNSSYYSNFGGVCGSLDKSNAVDASIQTVLATCYNAGTMTAETFACFGGIVGTVWTAESVSGNFNVGKLESSSNSNFGAISGWEDGSSAASYSDNGYLSSSGLHGYGDGTDKEGMTGLTPSEIVTAINQQLTSANGWQTTASLHDGKLTMPKLGSAGDEDEDDVIIDVPFTITLPTNVENGTITVDKESAIAGETITLTIAPENGFELESLTINGEAATVTGNTYTFTMPAENVTITVIFKEEEPSEPEKPVIPDYPDYYNIYMDACEGVTADTSTDVVREGSSMTFTLEVADGYTAENMVVKFKRSMFGYWETVTPDADGTYQIRNIYTDIYIQITGVEEENPTGIEQIAGVQVYTRNGSLFIQTPQQEQVSVISVSGTVLKKETVLGLRQFDGLQRGVYIVCVGNERIKVRL